MSKNLVEIVTNVLLSFGTIKQSATNMSRFFLHLNRTLNTTACNALSNIFDQTHLKCPLLKTEHMRRKDYSKYRLKQVGPRDNILKEVAYRITRSTAQEKYTAVQDTLKSVSSSIND